MFFRKRRQRMMEMLSEYESLCAEAENLLDSVPRKYHVGGVTPHFAGLIIIWLGIAFTVVAALLFFDGSYQMSYLIEFIAYCFICSGIALLFVGLFIFALGDDSYLSYFLYSDEYFLSEQLDNLSCKLSRMQR